MPDLKLEPLLEAARPDRLAPTLVPFLGRGDEPPRLASSRLQAPTCYWAVYQRGDRRATLKSFFSADNFERYAEQLRRLYPNRLDQPEHPRGGLQLLPDLNAVLWGFPFDPSMPHFHRAVDGAWVAGALRAASQPDLALASLGLDGDADSPSLPPFPTLTIPDAVTADVRRYNPEVGAIVAYADPNSAIAPVLDTASDHTPSDVLAYGKWSSDETSALIYVVMNRLWRSEGARSGALRLARPLAFRPAEGLLLQAPVPGAPLSSDRNQRPFLDLVSAAGTALAAIHQADCPFGPTRSLELDVGRLRAVVDDLQYAFPPLLRTLRLLLDQLEKRAARSRVTPSAPSHGDFKWDQFLAHESAFSLIDFELFCQAEPARDVGYFAAYLPPSRPEDWAESAAAEALRGAFFDSYAAATGQPLDLDRVVLYEAASLAIRALSHAWRRRADWHLRAGGLLEMALTRLVEPKPVRSPFSA